ncbi:MAG: SpoIIE family protein phosphatase [Aestuariibacter sp.]
MNVLVVDDESINRVMLLHMLEENGYQNCTEAENGEEAIQKAKDNPPDLVLLDVMMPGMSGIEVAPILKYQQQDLYLPIIYITSLEDDESLAVGLEVGGDDFVSKPFNKVVLAAKLKAHARTRYLSKKTYQQNQILSYHQSHIEREHTIVEHIFDNVLNLDALVSRFIDYHLAPATNFNGDVLLVERSPNAGLYILLGDFTGHGLASAIGAIPVSRAFQTMADRGVPVGEIAETLNGILLDFLPGGMFFACTVIEVANNGRTMDIWNGGLPHLILVDKAGNLKERFESRHMALGILEPDEFASDTVRYDLQNGDRLCGYTDGVIELHDDSGEMLGEAGLERWLTQNSQVTTAQIMQQVRQIQGGTEQADDISIFIYQARDLGLERKVRSLPKNPFSVELLLKDKQLANESPVSELVDLLSGHQSFDGVRSALFTVFSEIYTNALDHGVLQLDSKLKDTPDGFMAYFEEREKRLAKLISGEIKLTLRYIPEPACLIFNVTDSGTGFNADKMVSKVDSDNPYGRGIALVKELTDKVSFENNGTSVTTWFLLETNKSKEELLSQLPNS